MALDLQHLMKNVTADLRPRIYRCHDVIQQQYDPVKTINIILSGHAYARAVTYEGNEIWVDDFVRGDVFGCEAMMAETRAKYDVVSLSSVSVLSIPVPALNNIAEKHPAIMISLIEALSDKLHIRTQRLIEAQSLSSRGRICAELKRFCKPVGISPGTHIIRPVPVFSEFARRVGSTRESVSRTVSNLCKADIMARKTGALLILDMNRLIKQIK